ncbi:DnaA N-terminal domain-containing protein [Jhaorihella thermophila]|uniref:DnaA N-terminal domain-containing protein n=1 Tax=Jhaorihella thermophila TaxID=488547 RepID=A0A1H5UES5_9RHOB|nr:DnaA N-terminal domain-containing protein [Jhaorihella thermophila]SEF73573.1 DnaA N-terminal domain-containing protein [Jhaorihella thermophila]
MLNPRLTGRGAAARKYDLLTAMGAFALSQPKATQKTVLRLITLVTARYNWARDELAVGQREIARMWSVDERTVKREMAKLRGWGWLVVKRQGARGRVSEYGLDIDRILEDTRGIWAAVGPDFEYRMKGQPEPDSRVVPLPVRGEVPPPDIGKGDEWALAKAVLHAEDPSVYGSWIRALERGERAGGRLTLIAPSRFHAAYVETHLAGRVLAACQAVDDTVAQVVITA